MIGMPAMLISMPLLMMITIAAATTIMMVMVTVDDGADIGAMAPATIALM